MENTQKLQSLKEQIKQMAPKNQIELIEDASFDRAFLLVKSMGTSHGISLFDGDNLGSEFAKIRFSRSSSSPNLSVFEVNETHQQKGYGKFLFSLMLAYLDSCGITQIAGEARPTNNIQGISDSKERTFESEQMALAEIYKKLGCTIDENFDFSRTWKSGEILESATPLVKNLAAKLSEKDGTALSQNEPQ